MNSLIKIQFFILTACLWSVFASAAPKWKKIISNPSGGSSLQGGFMEFNKDGTWTVPTGVTKIQVMVIGGGGGAQGGGGGGGSCLKNGSTVLVSADGGNGGDISKHGFAGATSQTSLTVTAGTVLNVFVGGGGGGGYAFMDGSYNMHYYSGAGGYGACGSGGSGGNNAASTGGAGGSNKGGGSGAVVSRVGIASASATGADLVYNAAGSLGTNANTGGTVSSGSSGGGSGSIGGCYGTTAGVSLNSLSCFTVPAKKEPGEPGNIFSISSGNGISGGTGGGPGIVYIWW